MAYAAYAAALTRIAEVLADSAGSLRTVPAARFIEALHDGTDPMEMHRRGVVTSKPFRVEITDQERHGASPPIGGNLILYRVTFAVTVSRTIAPAAQADPDTMSALRALAWTDADVIRQALESAPNLLTTTAGVPTDIAGGALVYVRSRAQIDTERPPSTAQRYETVHLFTGVLKARPGTVAAPSRDPAGSLPKVQLANATSAVPGAAIVGIPGNWLNASTIRWIWLRDGVEITGYSDKYAYAIVLSDVGSDIGVRATAYGPGGSTVETSNVITAVAP